MSKEKLNLEDVDMLFLKIDEVIGTTEVVSNKDENLKNAIGMVSGVGTIGGAIGAGALISGTAGVAGGTMVAGSAATGSAVLATGAGVATAGIATTVALIAGPLLVLGGGSYLIARSRKKKKESIEREAKLQEAIRKQNHIIEILKNEANLKFEKIKELEGINIILTHIIERFRAEGVVLSGV